jgi:hypothetical protein
MMYMTPSTTSLSIPATPKVAGAALVASAIIVVYLGILPTQVLNWAAASIGSIF